MGCHGKIGLPHSLCLCLSLSPPQPSFRFPLIVSLCFGFLYLSNDFIEEIKLFLLYGASRDLIVFYYYCYYIRMKNNTRLGTSIYDFIIVLYNICWKASTHGDLNTENEIISGEVIAKENIYSLTNNNNNNNNA